MSDRRLTKEQLKAAQALVSGLSVGDVAATAGVSTRTIQRWCKQPAFQDHLAKSQEIVTDCYVEALEKTAEVTAVEAQSLNRRIEAASEKAVIFLEDLLSDKDARITDRVRAAIALLKVASSEHQHRQYLRLQSKQQEAPKRSPGLSDETAAVIRRQFLGIADEN